MTNYLYIATFLTSILIVIAAKAKPLADWEKK